MDALPQVGQKYQHKKWGEVAVIEIRKRGRGHQVWIYSPDSGLGIPGPERLKDFQKATN